MSPTRPPDGGMGAILAPSVALSLRGVGQLGAFGGVVWLGIEGATRVQRGGRRGCLAWLPVSVAVTVSGAPPVT